MKKIPLCFIFLLFCIFSSVFSQTNKPAVIAYYAGNAARIDSFNMNQITHIIFSFGHLKGNRLNIDNARDTATIQKLVAQKNKNPSLKVLLSLGGWGGCKSCSDIFSTKKGRKEFAKSVKELLIYFNADGIDLDWEYPAIEGYPGHPYKEEDKANFTDLVKTLREELGTEKIISFAAGGFTTFLQKSVDWHKVMTYCDFVNMMTYDLVNGASTVTGHLTPLYSTPQQKESTDNAINYLLSIGIPSEKIVLGAAFYGRLFENVAKENNGLYQAARFKSYVQYRSILEKIRTEDGYSFFWDDVAKASYGHNPAANTYITFEDTKSIALKTQYVIDKKLFGIMFWQLTEDKNSDGLLQAIDDVVNKKQ